MMVSPEFSKRYLIDNRKLNIRIYPGINPEVLQSDYSIKFAYIDGTYSKPFTLEIMKYLKTEAEARPYLDSFMEVPETSLEKLPDIKKFDD
jgi:hypothetical protein